MTIATVPSIRSADRKPMIANTRIMMRMAGVYGKKVV
jgi:hypothetical protein